MSRKNFLFAMVVVTIMSATIMAQDSVFTEEQKALIGRMERLANDRCEQIEIILGELVSIEEVNSFQQAAWDMAGWAVNNQCALYDYRSMLDKLTKDTFGNQYYLKATQLAKKFAPSKLDSTTEITDDWLWNNINSSFHHQDTVMVVVCGTSRDLQIATDKAAMSAREKLARWINIARHAPEDSGVLLEYSVIARQAVRKPGTRYEAAVLVKCPLTQNIL